LQLLLNNGLVVNLEDGDYGITMLFASKSGDKELVLLLLDKGFDVNEQLGGENDSALVVALARGHSDVLQLLLDYGADVNLQVGGDYGSALVAASCMEEEDAIKLLLDYGADVNLQVGGVYGNALEAASWGGNKGAIELLLANGADINTKSGGKWGSPLVAAVSSYGADIKLVQFLINNGADVHAEVGGERGSAIVAAASCFHWKGHTKLVEFILNNGADLNAISMTRDSGYISPLVAAVRKQAVTRRSPRMRSADLEFPNLSLIRILLEKGANVNLEVDGKWRNALEAAGKRERNENLRQLLYEYGATGELMSDSDEPSSDEESWETDSE